MKRRKNGFTLLEVLIATLLLTVGVLSIVGAFSSGIFTSGDFESVELALNLAQEKMEDIKNKTYANVASEVKSAVSGFSAFQRQVAVTVPQTNLKQVDVTVSWDTKGGQTNVSVMTLVANY
ncbi:MAG: prepilin-type N-terminal cleavage/methylation domain-containing protein [Candidatus Omnitrophota bacterium]|jgi:type IV pilus assembly protein PilV